MDKLTSLRRTLDSKLIAQLDIFKRVRKNVELLLVVGGGILTALGSLFVADIQYTGVGQLPKSAFVVFLGLVLTTLGTIFLIMTRGDDALVEASKAIEEAGSFKSEAENWSDFASALMDNAKQFRSLYMVYNNARHMLEQAARNRNYNENELIRNLIGAVKLDLRIALSFENHHTWTVVIYKALRDDVDGYNYLHAIAHDRSIECDISGARKWREGIGVGGIAFAKNDEVVAPDILDPSATSLFSLSGEILRQEDRTRYRSMFAVPVQLGTNQKPWGVVLASCSEENHFLSPIEEDEIGLENHVPLNNNEPLRALAGLVALAASLTLSPVQPV